MEGGLSFQNFWKKSGSDFFHETGGVGKIGGVVLKKGVSLIFILPLSNVTFFWVFGVCVCVCFVYCLFTPFLSVLFVFHSLIASNQQIYDFYKRIIFEKKRHCGK